MDYRQRERYLRRLNNLKNERETFWAHWKDINKYLLPRRGRFMTSDRNKGDKRNSSIIDSTATQALNTLVSGMMSGVTSPSRKWFRLATPDRDLMEFAPVKEWLTVVEERIYEVFFESNLYRVLPYVYEEMAAYGTAAMIQLDDDDDVTRFQSFSVGEYCIAQDHSYRTNAIYREIEMTVEQIVRRYGLDNASDYVQRCWDKGDYDKWIEVVHLIEQNEYADPESPLAKDKEWKSCTFEKGKGVNDQYRDALEESGYDYFPVYAPRWHLMPPDVYGRSPGMDALGDIKQLQDQHKKKGAALAKMVNPPMVGPASLKNARMTTLPGDVTFVDTTAGSQGFTPAYQVQPRLAEFVADMQDVRDRIRQGFYADLFLMLANSDRRQVTATEIEEKRAEKLLVLGPVLERLNTDLLDPLVMNTFRRAVLSGIIPPPPEDFADIEMNVEYISIMASAQRQQGIGGLQDTGAFVGSLAAINPDIVDKFDFDQAVDEFAMMRGVPAGVIRSDDDVEELRQARAQQQQQMAAQASTIQAAQGAKLLSEAEPREDNMLGQLAGQMGALQGAGAP
tara:strand:+ start:3577 stop:5268 length:1692 start_codon:yes stop_codon:yes gene_type:complete